MARHKAPSFLAGREVGRKKRTEDFAISSAEKEKLEKIQQEAASITDVSAVPLIPFELIDPNPFQKRRKMDEDKLEELRNDMRAHGITTLLIGRRNPTNPERIQIAYGHRRIEAAKHVGTFTGYPILLKDLSDWDMRWLLIGENRYREDLTPLEEGYLLKGLLESGMTQEEAAAAYQISRGTLRDLVALTEDDPDIQSLVEARHDTVRAARELRKVEDKEIRAQVIASLLAGEISGSQVRAYIETLKQEKQLKTVVSTESATQTATSEVYTLHNLSSEPEFEDIEEEDLTEHASIESRAYASHSSSGSEISIVAESRNKSEDQLDQSRLRTISRQLKTIEQRILKRVEQGSTISEEIHFLLQEIADRAEGLLQKLP